jgi:hypothetical protein
MITIILTQASSKRVRAPPSLTTPATASLCAATAQRRVDTRSVTHRQRRHAQSSHTTLTNNATVPARDSAAGRIAVAAALPSNQMTRTRSRAHLDSATTARSLAGLLLLLVTSSAIAAHSTGHTHASSACRVASSAAAVDVLVVALVGDTAQCRQRAPSTAHTATSVAASPDVGALSVAVASRSTTRRSASNSDCQHRHTSNYI